MNACLFCTYAHNPQALFYENNFFVARYDRYPVSPGHALIFPKRHVVPLLSLEDNEWTALKDALLNATQIIKTVDKYSLYSSLLNENLDTTKTVHIKNMLANPNLGKTPDGFNYGNNDGEAAGRTIHHLHIHIIPRYFGDVPNSTGGIRNIIPGMGSYKS